MVRAPRRVGVARIQERDALQVSFSKRRQGLFKKVAELSTLCGTESAIFIKSPGEKIYSLGEPDVHSVIDRFLNRAAAGEATQEDFWRRMINQEMFDCLQSYEVWLEAANAKLNELNREIREISRRQTFRWCAEVADLETAEVDQMLCALVKAIAKVEQELSRRENDALQEPPRPHLPEPIPPLHPAPRQPAMWENPTMQPYTGALQEPPRPHLPEPISPLHHVPRQPAAWENPARRPYTGAAGDDLYGGVSFPGFAPSVAFSLAGAGSSSGYPLQGGMGVDPVRRLHGFEDFSQGDYVGAGWSGFGGQSSSSAALGQNLAGFHPQELGALPPLPISWLGHSSLLAQPARGYNYYNPIWPGESSSSVLFRTIGGEGDQRSLFYPAPLPGWIPLPPPPEDGDGPSPPL